MKGTEFRGNKSLKLVAYCHLNKKYEQYNTKEYLAYRLYNELTPMSLHVRLARISYENPDKPSRFSNSCSASATTADRALSRYSCPSHRYAM